MFSDKVHWAFKMDLSFIGKNKPGKIITGGGTADVRVKVNDIYIKPKH